MSYKLEVKSVIILVHRFSTENMNYWRGSFEKDTKLHQNDKNRDLKILLNIIGRLDQ